MYAHVIRKRFAGMLKYYQWPAGSICGYRKQVAIRRTCDGRFTTSETCSTSHNMSSALENLVTINSPLAWVECFQAFIAVVVKKAPDHVPNLLAYCLVIVHAGHDSTMTIRGRYTTGTSASKRQS